MTPAELTSLLAEAKGAYGSANADKLGRLVERLAAALEQAAAVIAEQKAELARRASKIDELLKRIEEQDVEITELKTRAGEQAATLSYLKAQVFGPKSEQLRYLGGTAATTQTASGIDDDEPDPAPAEAAQSGAVAYGGEASAKVPMTAAPTDSPATPTPVADGDAVTPIAAVEALPGLVGAGIDDESVPDSPPPVGAAQGTAAADGGEAGAMAPTAAASTDARPPPTPAANGDAVTPGAAAEALPGPTEATTDKGAAPTEGTAQSDEQAKKVRRRRARKLERQRRPQGSKRTVFGPEVQQEIVRHLLPPGLELPCPLCGDLVRSRGKSVESKEIDTVESTVVARTHHRVKASCDCGALSFVMPGPVRAVPNMVFSPAFAAKVLVDKFFAHLPLNRQAALLGQQGLKISRDRLITLVIGCWLAVESLVKRIREVNRAQSHQGCDESQIRVVVEGEKAMRFIWCLTSKLAVTYQITPKRNKDTAREVVGTAVGVLTSDRLAIYRKLFEGKAESGCMSHLRRYFWYALDTAPEAAMPIIELIGELYDVEADAKNQGLGPEERKALRAAKSAPILARLETQLKATAPPPRTPIAKAVNYAMAHWPALTFYLSDGAVEIDNNECERRLRLPKLGWANWKQPQSELGIEAVAGFYTIISTCALHGINPRRYLADVLTKLGTGWPARRLDELLPWNWQDGNAVYGPPAPHRRNIVHAAAEIIELAQVRARVKAARNKAAALR